MQMMYLMQLMQPEDKRAKASGGQRGFASTSLLLTYFAERHRFQLQHAVEFVFGKENRVLKK